jgi:hypothetical protein
MTEVKKFRVEKQIVDALNTRNNSNVSSIHDLLLNSDVLIWREDTNHRDKWIESFKLLSIDDETCKIDLSSDSIEFRNIVIKSFLTENDDKSQNLFDNLEFENNLAFTTISSILEFEDDSASLTRSFRTKRLFMRYQNVADILVFLQNDQFNLTFVNSRRKEINDLLEKRVYELITIDKVSKDVRIFNSRFVDEIKHSETSQAYEKSRLVI